MSNDPLAEKERIDLRRDLSAGACSNLEALVAAGRATTSRFDPIAAKP
jgi:hypothetical protein